MSMPIIVRRDSDGPFCIQKLAFPKRADREAARGAGRGVGVFMSGIRGDWQAPFAGEGACKLLFRRDFAYDFGRCA
ncbi:hypothetical protein [Ancylobacter sp. G4_0304]|uniref:hypothetical protein n=1 Tax=Ancylobacter sp. G4_0304 TaxID=3114289 RepID=UPI0039C71360